MQQGGKYSDHQTLTLPIDRAIAYLQCEKGKVKNLSPYLYGKRQRENSIEITRWK